MNMFTFTSGKDVQIFEAKIKELVERLRTSDERRLAPKNKSSGYLRRDQGLA